MVDNGTDRTFIRLSYTLSPSTPTPGGRCPLRIALDESLAGGYSANTFFYTSWNHAGSHVDGPAHMVAHGKRVSDFPIGHFFFERPVVIDVPTAAGELIGEGEVRGYEEEIRASDLVLLRTGFGTCRSSDPTTYATRNPGISPAAAHFLGGPGFVGLRAIAIDTISIASASHPAAGVEAHLTLFSRPLGPPLLLIEDIDLSADLAGIRSVFVVPFYIEGLDSAPCTVIAELDASAA